MSSPTTTNTLRKQKWRNAQFHSHRMWVSLADLRANLLCSTKSLLVVLPTTRLSPLQPEAWFSDDHIEEAYQLVCREDFNDMDHTHLAVLLGFAGRALAEVDHDYKLLASQACDDALIDRWLSWEDAQRSVGCRVPFAGDLKVIDTPVWRGVWAAIRAAAPKGVEVEKGSVFKDGSGGVVVKRRNTGDR